MKQNQKRQALLGQLLAICEGDFANERNALVMSPRVHELVICQGADENGFTDWLNFGKSLTYVFAVKTHRNPVGHIPEEYILARDTLFF